MFDQLNLNLTWARLRIPGFKRVLMTQEVCRSVGLRPRAMIRTAAARGIQVLVTPNPVNDLIAGCDEGGQQDKDGVFQILERVPIEAVQYASCIQLELQKAELDLNKEEHLRIVSLWANRLLLLSDRITKLAAAVKPHGILFFQGYLPDSAVLRRIGIQRGIPFLAIERSAFDKRLIWDNVSGITVNKNLGRNLYWRHNDSLSDWEAMRFASHYLENHLPNKQKEHESSNVFYRFAQLPPGRLRILFIGQVYTDSSVLFGLRNNLDPISVVEDLARFCLNEGHFLIVKLHPKENGGSSPLNTAYDRLTFRKIRQQSVRLGWSLEETVGIIDHENRYNTNQLIRDCDVVVTLNSQAGLEAALTGKPVIVFGEAFYRDLGFTIDARDREDLVGILHHLDRASIQPETVRLKAARFFHSYFNEYSFMGSPACLIRIIKEKVL